MLARKTPSAARPSPMSSGWWWLRGRRGPLRVLTRLGTLGRSLDLRFFRATGRSSAGPRGLLLSLALDRRVRREDRARRRYQTVDEPERPGHGVVAKDALASAQDERVDHQAELV